MKKLLCIAGLLSVLNGYGQDCPELLSPEPGSTEVPVTQVLSWENITGVPGYIVSLGTAPGGDDILRESVGAATSYRPPRGLPENTLVYVTITLFFFDRPDIVCDSFSFRTEDVTTPPGCSLLAGPLDGDTGIPVASSLRWNYSPTATGYRLAIGTTPGGEEILPLTDLENTLSYNPPADFDELSDVYVRLIPYNENGNAQDCREQQFQTGALASLPQCTTMVYPADGELNVPLSPQLEWNEVPGADGYVVSVGTSPQENDILDNATFFETSTDFINFEPNSIYYVRVIPFNAAGAALDCGPPEVFSTILGCGPYFDATSGELVILNPEITFPEQFGICQNDPAAFVSATDEADGYRWFEVESPGRERLLAEGRDFLIPGEGTYRLEIYEGFSGPSGSFECSSSQVFTVAASEAPQINNTRVRLGSGTLRITVEVSGAGSYEYAIGDPAGPYQDSNIFEGLPVDTYTIYVRDKNGCGIAETIVEPDLSAEGFPRFFTPNGDGINDYWQFIQPPSGSNPLRRLAVFDRYGNLVAQVDPASRGWDGTYNGRPLPPNDYWFRAVDRQGKVLQGHFTLKR